MARKKVQVYMYNIYIYLTFIYIYIIYVFTYTHIPSLIDCVPLKKTLYMTSNGQTDHLRSLVGILATSGQ